MAEETLARIKRDTNRELLIIKESQYNDDGKKKFKSIDEVIKHLIQEYNKK